MSQADVLNESRGVGWLAAAQSRLPAILKIAGALLFAAGVATLYVVDPAQGGFYPSCLLHQFTGLNCPGCGTLRGLHQLLHGHFAAAWAMNPLAMCLTPGLIAVGICSQVAAWRSLPGRLSRRLGARWIWCLFVVIVAYGVLRNVPIWPCTLLAPH